VDEIIKLKRGGQPGNRNARKHTFYTSALDDAQKRVLKQAASIQGLDEEVDILRIQLKAVILREPENARLISQIAVSLARLMQAREKIGKNDPHKLADAIRHVIEDIGIPLGIKTINRDL
jgi:hypothetical protein